jgi:hypothetical protein
MRLEALNFDSMLRFESRNLAPSSIEVYLVNSSNIEV